MAEHDSSCGQLIRKTPENVRTQLYKSDAQDFKHSINIIVDGIFYVGNQLPHCFRNDHRPILLAKLEFHCTYTKPLAMQFIGAALEPHDDHIIYTFVHFRLAH